MNDTITNTIDEALTELGPDIKEAAYNTAWDYVCREIAKKHKLTPTKTNLLSAETGMYIAFIIDFKEYLEEIQKMCADDNDLFRAILMDLTTEIIEPYTHYLKENKQDITQLITDIEEENKKIDEDLREPTEHKDELLFNKNALIKIPIKPKTSSDPILTQKTTQNFSSIQKPSSYTSNPDPYHEEL